MKKLFILSIILCCSCGVLQIDEEKTKEEIKKLQTINSATAPINPYAPIIDLGLKVALGFLGTGTAAGVIISKRNKSEMIYQKKKYKSHEAGVNDFRRKHPELFDELFNDIGKARAKILLNKKVPSV